VKPEITVIIPTHNRRDLLPLTLRTVLDQQNVALDVVVVDDGSSDDTSALVAHWPDRRVRLIRHERPAGVSASRNRGVQAATGEWVAFCDDDDVWAPRKLALQLAAARETRREWCYAVAVLIDRDLAIIGLKVPPAPEHLVARLPHWNQMPGGSSNVIVRTALFQHAGGWDPRLVNLADWDLWIRLARSGVPACDPALLVGYRVHAGNASANTRLILNEAQLIEKRYGEAVDYGELHHYLAWIHLRAGRSRAALPHLARAAVRGEWAGVTRTIAAAAERRLGRPLLRAPNQEADRRAQRKAEAEAWLGPLRSKAGFPQLPPA
jgi:glycosyltransferase involved in cell wall biosynthesis